MRKMLDASIYEKEERKKAEEEKILQNQLAKMGFTSQNIEDTDEDEESEKINENEIILNKKNENLTDEELFQRERHNKIIQQRKNMKSKRKFLLNIDKDKKFGHNKIQYLCRRPKR